MKSSLGRRSSVTRKTGDFNDRNRTSIPVFSRSKSSASITSNSATANSVARKRDLSADRKTTVKKRDPSNDRMSEYSAFNTPCSSSVRPVRSMTMSSGRPSSISGWKNDDRPLTDKEWQLLATELIFDVMNQDQVGSEILRSCKSLKPMTLALFVDMSNHFVRKLDSKYELNRVNYLTELPHILKMLKYRGKVDKMLLQTVNTMHNFPHVLGILHFLAELVQAMEAFIRRELDPLFPHLISLDPLEEELNFKLMVPLFHDLKAQIRQMDYNLDSLIEENMPKISEIIVQSGFTDDILKEEENMAKEIEALNMECSEFTDECDEVEREYFALNEKRVAKRAKIDSEKKELDKLRARLQQELVLTTELENDVKYLENEHKVNQGILEQYQLCDNGELSPEDYETYKKTKKELRDNITFEKEIIFDVKDTIFEEECAITDLEKECEKLFKSYNSKILDVMKHDVSVKGALSYTRPKLGATPCNEATAVLLERILEKHNEQLAQLESRVNNSEDTSFELSEEVKKKSAKRKHVKTLHEMAVTDYEESNAELNKQLAETLKKETEIEHEVETTKECLKITNDGYEELYNKIIKKEVKLRKFFEVCRKKMELRFQSIKMFDQKFVNMIEKEEQVKQRFSHEFQIIVENNSIPNEMVDEIQKKTLSLDTDNQL